MNGFDDRLNDGRFPDLTRHFKQLAKVALPALLLAVLVAGLTMLVMAGSPSAYKATVIAQIDAQVPVVSGDGYLYQMNAPYVALANSDALRQAVASKMGEGWNVARVQHDISVAVAKSPLLLEVSAVAPDQAQALQLARVTVQALDEQSRAQRAGEINNAVSGPTADLQTVQQQLAGAQRSSSDSSDSSSSTTIADPIRAPLETRLKNLQDEIDRIRAGGVNGLSILSAPDESDIPAVATSSRVVAWSAGLVTFIVTAECMVLLRGRFGSRLTFASAQRIGYDNGISVEATDTLDEMPPVTQGMISRRASRGLRTMVLVTPRADTAVQRWFTEQKLRDRIVLEPIDANWAEGLTGDVGLAVIVAKRGEDIRSQVASTARTLALLDVPGRLVLAARSSSAQHREAAASPDAETSEVALGADF